MSSVRRRRKYRDDKFPDTRKSKFVMSSVRPRRKYRDDKFPDTRKSKFVMSSVRRRRKYRDDKFPDTRKSKFVMSSVRRRRTYRDDKFAFAPLEMTASQNTYSFTGSSPNRSPTVSNTFTDFHLFTTGSTRL